VKPSRLARFHRERSNPIASRKCLHIDQTQASRTLEIAAGNHFGNMDGW